MQIQSWKQLNELRSELYQALESSANFYPNIHCVLKVLYLSTKRLTGLALMNIHTDLEIDSEEVLKQFDATGRRAMRLGCNPLFARVCECACVSLAFYLSPLNNVTYKHIGLAETNKQTNKQTNNPRGNTHFWTDEQMRFMLNQLLLLVVVKRSSGNGCITTSCNENSATYRIGYDMLSANDSIYSLPCILG